MVSVIDIAIVTGNALMIGGLQAWTTQVADIRLAAFGGTADSLLAEITAPVDVCLFDLCHGGNADPMAGVQRLASERYRVLVLSTRGNPGAAAAHAAGALGVVMLEQSLDDLAAAIRSVVMVDVTGLPRIIEGGPRLSRPSLSERERAVLAAYISGMTLETAARHVGVALATAKTYLQRVKAKYEDVGRPAHTKVDLARRVWEESGELVTPQQEMLDHRRSKQSGLTGDTDLTSEPGSAGDDLPVVKCSCEHARRQQKAWPSGVIP